MSYILCDVCADILFPPADRPCSAATGAADSGVEELRKALLSRLEQIELLDILELLADQEITPRKALEAIHERVAGIEPVLPARHRGNEKE